MKRKIATLLLTSVLAIGLLLSGCSFSYTPPSADNANISDAEAEESSVTKKDSETIYEIGDSASLKDWTISVTDSKILYPLEQVKSLLKFQTQ